jgi:hypothetical protein
VKRGEASVDIGVSASSYNAVRMGRVVRVRHIQQGVFADKRAI